MIGKRPDPRKIDRETDQEMEDLVVTKKLVWRVGSLVPVAPMAAVVLAAVALTGCDATKKQLGLTKNAPDEFTVVTKAPLVIPPDFTLRPPRPGAKRPQEITPRQDARETVVEAAGGARATQVRTASAAQAALGAAGSRPAATTTVTMAPAATAETALLREAGALDADPNIREQVNRETTQLAEKDSSFADRLIFWQAKIPPGSTLDAEKEAQRLREAAATGASPNEGDTPVIVRRKRGWLEGIF
jgi:hypothetical protein